MTPCSPLWQRIIARYALASLVLIAVIVGARQSNAGSYFTPDGTQPKDFSFLKVGNTWHTIGIHGYYSPAPGGPGSPGLIHSTSTDMISWTDIGAAIEVGAAGTWESYDVWAPTIIKNGATYHMWYTGVKKENNQWVQKIGHATSTDLTTWTKDPANPVWDCSTLSWTFWDPNSLEAAGTDCRDPFVIRDEANNQWVMFYTARVESTPTAPYWLTNPPVVGMATSPDLVTWNDAGYHITTAGFAAESPHIIERNGTWWLIFTTSCSWRGNKCLRYATAPALTGPYTGYADLPAVGGDEYASEYFKDESGQEYFGRVGSTNGWLDFDYLNWPNNQFTLSSTPSGLITGKVWTDNNGNGLIDSGEGGVTDLSIIVYKDNGDEVFDPVTDTSIQTAPTFGGANPLASLYGTYRVPFISINGELPWALLWIRLDPDNLDYSTPPLTGMTPTTTEVIRFDNRAGGLTLANANFGYNGNDNTAPAAVADLQLQ